MIKLKAEVLFLLVSAIYAQCAQPPFQSGSPDGFLVGADLSWVPQQEARGRTFSDNGVETDILTILKEHGFNSVRLRLFVDPTAPGGYSPEGYCGLESSLQMARRVRDAKMHFLLDLHYSDTWADPGHQKKPVVWRELDLPQLTNAVLRYTSETLVRFDREGLAPGIVQVGNEISNGVLWPEGRLENFGPMAELLRAGISAVRHVLPGTKIMLHLALGGQNEKSRWFLDRALQHKLDFDIIGQSYYPRWHGTLDDLKTNLEDLARRYRQGIMVVEYSTPHVLQVNEIVRSLPGAKGLGTFIWEPTHPAHGHLFDEQGRALPALDDYVRVRKVKREPKP